MLGDEPPSDHGFPSEADVDAVIAEFDGDARTAVRALLRDAASVDDVLALMRRLVRVECRPELPAGEGSSETESVRWPVEDSPVSGDADRLEVLVMRGTARSTVLIVDERTGRAVSRDVVEHGTEAVAAGRAVEEAVRRVRENT